MKDVKPVLRAAALTAFIIGTILFLLNPPSLSGAEELISLVAGALALVLLSAWAAVALTGRESLSEAEVDRMVARSEELARRPPPPLDEDRFGALVEEAIEELPDEFRAVLERVPVVVSYLGAEAGAYGHYMGDTVARDNHPDRIVLYRDTLERDFGHDPDLLAAQVERTLRHELAHHLGWNEQGVRGLGL